MTEGPDETVPLESAPYGAEGPVDGPRTLEGEVALFPAEGRRVWGQTQEVPL